MVAIQVIDLVKCLHRSGDSILIICHRGLQAIGNI